MTVLNVRYAARKATAIAMALGLFASACGGQGAFPEAAPCDPPQPTPTPRSQRGGAVDGIYRNIVLNGLTTLESTSQTFRAEWPFERPSSNLEFRQAFVDYARTMTCTAEYLRGLEPASEVLSDFDAKYDALMDETIKVTEDGRESVKARNTSDFRDWIRQVEAMPARYDELIAALPSPQ